ASRALSAEALAKEVRLLQRGHRIGVLTAAERARALEIEREIVRLLQDGTLALEDRITLAEQLQALQEITPKIEPPPADALAKIEPPRIRIADTMGLLPARAPIQLKPIRDARAEIDALAEAWLATNGQMGAAAQNAAMGIAGAFQDAFSALLQDMS